jgi:hypothetical protein
VLVSLAGVASIFLGLGKNSYAYWFSGILHTGMMALTSPFMKYSSAQNKIMRLALRFTCRLYLLPKCKWMYVVSRLCELLLSGSSSLLTFKFQVDDSVQTPFCSDYGIALCPE